MLFLVSLGGHQNQVLTVTLIDGSIFFYFLATMLPHPLLGKCYAADFL